MTRLLQHCTDCPNTVDTENYMTRLLETVLSSVYMTLLAMKLQQDATLTLTKDVASVHQAEAIKQQQPLMRGGNHTGKQDTPVEAVQQRRGKPATDRQNSKAGNKQSTKAVCGRCGESPLTSVSSAQHVMRCATNVPNADTFCLCVGPLPRLQLSIETISQLMMCSWGIYRDKTNAQVVRGIIEWKAHPV